MYLHIPFEDRLAWAKDPGDFLKAIGGKLSLKTNAANYGGVYKVFCTVIASS